MAHGAPVRRNDRRSNDETPARSQACFHKSKSTEQERCKCCVSITIYNGSCFDDKWDIVYRRDFRWWKNGRDNFNRGTSLHSLVIASLIILFHVTTGDHHAAERKSTQWSSLEFFVEINRSAGERAASSRRSSLFHPSLSFVHAPPSTPRDEHVSSMEKGLIHEGMKGSW